MTAIVARDRWGAPGGWRTTAPMRLPAARLWVHHGATGSPTLATLRAYHRYHRSLGWAGLGYSWAITGDGTIYEGRGDRLGAHTSGDNAASLGVVLVGDWTSATVPEAMVRSLADLARHLHATGLLVTPTITGGHRDAPGASTSCPGAGGMDAIARARRLLHHRPSTTVPSDPLEEWYMSLTPQRRARLERLLDANPDALVDLAQLLGAADRRELAAMIKALRAERVDGADAGRAVGQLARHVDTAGSSVQGVVYGALSAVDAVRDLGYVVDPARGRHGVERDDR